MARTISPAVAHTRARVAALSRHCASDAKRAEAKRDHRSAVLADYIDRVLSEAPTLTDDQRCRLAELLRPARNGGAV